MKKEAASVKLDQKERLKSNISQKKEQVEQSKQVKETILKDILSDLKELERQEDKLLRAVQRIRKENCCTPE